MQLEDGSYALPPTCAHGEGMAASIESDRGVARVSMQADAMHCNGAPCRCLLASLLAINNFLFALLTA